MLKRPCIKLASVTVGVTVLMAALTCYVVPISSSLLNSHATESTRWKKIDLPLFSFHLPVYMKRSAVKGVDSAMWVYTGDHMQLTIDLGRYSTKPKLYEGKPEYREESILIDGRTATFCSFRLRNPVPPKNDQYVAAAYFSDVGSLETNLNFVAVCDSAEERELARQVFNSIKFKPATGP